MKKIDIKDFMNYHYPTGMTAAPDGKHGVFAVLDPNEDENCYRSGLWLIDLPEGNYRPLTGGKAERAFAWLDSDTVLFIANREKEYQEKVKNGEDWTCFYTINIHGGEAEFAFAVPYAVTKMAAVKDKIVFCVNYDYNKPEFFRMDEDKKKEALKLWEEEKDYEVFDELPFWENGPGIVNKKRIRLAVYDRASKNVTFVSPDHETVENFGSRERISFIPEISLRICEAASRHSTLLILQPVREKSFLPRKQCGSTLLAGSRGTYMCSVLT